MTRVLAVLLGLLCLAPGAFADEPRELVDVLKKADVKAQLTTLLGRDPAATLKRLPLAFEIAIEEAPASATRITAGVSEAVAAAVAAAPDPRLFMQAAERKRTPVLLLGVVRGASVVLDRPVPTDQGAPDWEAFLTPLVRFADDAAVRAAACETIGKVAPTQGTARALIRALSDEEAAVKRAALQALQRASKANDTAGFERWASTLPAGLAITPELLRGLATNGAVRRGPAADWLLQQLSTSPRDVIDELTRALLAVTDQLESQDDPAAGSAELTAVNDRVASMVSDAFQATNEVPVFLEHAPDAAGPIAAGIARGIGARTLPFVTRANRAEWKDRPGARTPEPSSDASPPDEVASPGEPEVPSEPREIPYEAEFREVLALLVVRPEPAVAVEAIRAAAIVLTSLDARWLQLLTAPLEAAEHGDVAREAWIALKWITKEDLPPSAPHWRRRHEGPQVIPDPASGN